MKLRRLRLENFRRFKEPLLLDSFGDGLNIFAAPNESGKSTVAEAVRSAFFERHKTSSVEHLRPWGDSSAAPTVELDFDLNGRLHRLTKSFLGRKRCDLRIEGQAALDGAAAEDHLAAVLGFRFPGKGASAPEHMGIPGLLWIRQARSHELADDVHHAADHLREVLGASLGELTSSTGDALLRRVEGERNELLTPVGGQPRGELAAARLVLAELEPGLEQLAQDIASYRSRVDQLATLRREHERAERERPWERLRDQHRAAQAQLDSAKSLQARLADEQRALQQWTAQAGFNRTELEALGKDETAAETRDKAAQRACAHEAAALLEQQAWERRHHEAQLAWDESSQALRGAQAVRLLDDTRRAVADLETSLAAQADALSRARDASARLARQQAEADALLLAPADVKRLKQLAQNQRDADLRLDAAATTLELELPESAAGAAPALRIDGVAVSGHQRLNVVRRTVLDLGAAGRISIVPGGTDLETLALQRDRLQSELGRLLQGLGLQHAADADERVRRAQQRQQEALASRQLLEALAPQGADALQAEMSLRQQRLGELRALLAEQLAGQGAQETVQALSLPEAQAQSERAQSRLAQTLAQLQAARLSAARTQADHATALQELANARVTLADPTRAQRLLSARLALTDALAHQASSLARAEALEAELRGLNLGLLQQEVERYAKSSALLEETQAERRHAMTRLEVELETRGAVGLEEQHAQKLRETEAARRRTWELQRRADALDHLLQLLRRQRAQLAQRLRAPLQRHLDHYVQMAFPGARIEVAEDLSPGVVQRPGVHGQEQGSFEALSVGAREQLGIIARLAYAELLLEAGRPTLLILDDALVHTDEERLARMKRVLYDAAQRHQVLVFTCHPGDWQDLGVPVRGLS